MLSSLRRPDSFISRVIQKTIKESITSFRMTESFLLIIYVRKTYEDLLITARVKAAISVQMETRNEYLCQGLFNL